VVTLIILIFVPRDLTAELAHVWSHCATGITLPPVDATIFFIGISVRWDLKKKLMRRRGRSHVGLCGDEGENALRGV